MVKRGCVRGVLLVLGFVLGALFAQQYGFCGWNSSAEIGDLALWLKHFLLIFIDRGHTSPKYSTSTYYPRLAHDLQEIEAEHEASEVPLLRRHRTGCPLKPEAPVWCEEDHEANMCGVQGDGVYTGEVEMMGTGAIAQRNLSPPVHHSGWRRCLRVTHGPMAKRGQQLRRDSARRLDRDSIQVSKLP